MQLPLQANVCNVQVHTKSGDMPSSKDTMIVNVSHPDNPLVTGGPYLVSPDENGLVTVPINNCSPLSVEIDRNEFIGVDENASTPFSGFRGMLAPFQSWGLLALFGGVQWCELALFCSGYAFFTIKNAHLLNCLHTYYCLRPKLLELFFFVVVT